MMTLRACIVVAIMASLSSEPTRAGEWSAAGFVFSDELGGFQITSVTGEGTAEDPVVIVERFNTIEPAILVVRRAPSERKTNRSPGAHPGANHERDFLKLAVKAVISNASGRTWAGFDLELQENRGQPSVYLDGLSFDQMKAFGARVFRSDRFAVFTDLTEPYDRVRFEQGFVNPGDVVRFSFFVTDVTPRNRFYILQEPKVLSAKGPIGSRVKEARAGSLRQAVVIPGSSRQVHSVLRHKRQGHYRSPVPPRP